MIEVRQSWRRLCLLSPFYDGLVPALIVAGLFVTMAFLLAGVWIAAPIAAAALLVFELRSAGMRLAADGSGVHVRNRFVTHHIPWSDLRGVSVTDRWQNVAAGFLPPADRMPVLRIDRLHSAWSSITVYAAIGLHRSELEELGRRLVDLARENGYEPMREFPDNELAAPR